MKRGNQGGREEGKGRYGIEITTGRRRGGPPS